jgi:hypothetical protein
MTTRPLRRRFPIRYRKIHERGCLVRSRSRLGSHSLLGSFLAHAVLWIGRSVPTQRCGAATNPPLPCNNIDAVAVLFFPPSSLSTTPAASMSTQLLELGNRLPPPDASWLGCVCTDESRRPISRRRKIDQGGREGPAASVIQYWAKRRRRTIGTPVAVSPTISWVTPGGNEPSALARAAWPFATSVWTKCLVASSCGTITSSCGAGSFPLRRLSATSRPYAIPNGAANRNRRGAGAVAPHRARSPARGCEGGARAPASLRGDRCRCNRRARGETDHRQRRGRP